MSSVTFTDPLEPTKRQIKKHALLCSIGFIVLLPLGSLVGRYLRTFTGRWFWAHSFIQFLLAGPIIFAGWYYGYNTTANLNTGGHFVDPHKKIGLALLILYLVQLLLGSVIHSIKTPRLMGGRRPPQNYFHAILGIAIIALAFYQVHYGIVTEYFEAIEEGPVPMSAMHAWEALIVIFFVLYFAGLALLPRQYGQEAEFRNGAGQKA